MLTSSETILNLLIWTLTGAGLFFGGRAAWRRRMARKRRQEESAPLPPPDPAEKN